MQKVRIALRGKAVVVMGKNTLIRKIMRDMIEGEKLTKLEALLPLVVGNMGFVFTNHNLPEIRKIILDNKVPAAAKSGSFAPADVYIPPGPTGLDPVRQHRKHGLTLWLFCLFRSHHGTLTLRPPLPNLTTHCLDCLATPCHCV